MKWEDDSETWEPVDSIWRDDPPNSILSRPAVFKTAILFMLVMLFLTDANAATYPNWIWLSNFSLR